MKIAFSLSPSPKAQSAFDKIEFDLKKLDVVFFVFNPYVDVPEIPEDYDAVVSLGGDGTFLRSAPYAVKLKVPILGFNLGSLGFLTEAGIDDYKSVLERLIKGDYQIKERMLLECSVERDGRSVFSSFALNEAVAHRGSGTKILHLSFYIDGTYAGSYKADGLIAATPTGSTAYSLAAGGPIVSPETECVILTAVAPHTLSARPLALPSDKIVKICETSSSHMSLSLDGHLYYELLPNDNVFVKKRSEGLKFVSLGKDFYGAVREKLGWT